MGANNAETDERVILNLPSGYLSGAQIGEKGMLLKRLCFLKFLKYNCDDDDDVVQMMIMVMVMMIILCKV